MIVVVPVGPAIVWLACWSSRDLLRLLHLFFSLDLSFLGFVMINRLFRHLGMSFIFSPSRVPSVSMPAIAVSTHGAKHIGQRYHRNAQYQQTRCAGQSPSQSGPPIHSTTGLLSS